MFLNELGNNLSVSFQGLWTGVIAFIPNLVVAIVILLIGWGVSAIVFRGISTFFKMIKFDEALRKTGLDDVVRKGGLTLNSGHFIGKLVQYFIVIAFLIASFDVLGLSQVTAFLQQIVLGYLPQLIIAVLILLVGSVVGDAMSRIVMASARTAGLMHASLLGAVTRWGIWIFAILVALSQMGIAGAFIQTLFTGFVVAVSLALGLSFGLGGQQAAAHTIERIKGEISHH